MNKFLDYRFLDNTVATYLVVIGIILVAVIFRRFISKYLAGLLFRIVTKVSRGVDKKSFVGLVVSPLETFLLILVTIIAFDKLNFPEALNVTVYKTGLKQIIDGIARIILIIAFIWLILRIMDFIAMILEQRANITEDHTDNQLIVFFKDFFKVIWVIVGILMVLKYAFGYHISSLITGLSLAGAAIALATRESIENLIASFIIFFDKPFTTGDLVKVQSITGTVEKIGLRSTRIRSDQKTFVTVPNKQMVDGILDNLSLRSQRKGNLQLDLDSKTGPDLVQKFVGLVEGYLADRKDKIESFSVWLTDIQKNALIVSVEFFTAPIPIQDFNQLKQDINFRVIRLMEEIPVHLVSKEDAK